MANFEDSLKELEQVVERLERGGLPLEESLRLFERGVTVSRECKTELDNAESRISKLVLTRDGREMRTEPVDLSERGFASEENDEGDDEQFSSGNGQL